jgi:quercetin dioxygenase-like cupin family protein
MRVIQFRNGRPVNTYDSIGLAIAPLTAPLTSEAGLQAACFRLEPGGRVGRHPAGVAQLLVVTEGAGFVSGSDGSETPIASGKAAFWDAGEEHETRTEFGLTAIVIESPGLRLP